MKKKTKTKFETREIRLVGRDTHLRNQFHEVLDDLILAADRSGKVSRDDIKTMRAIYDKFDPSEGNSLEEIDEIKARQFEVEVYGEVEVPFDDCIGVIQDLVEGVDQDEWKSFIVDQSNQLGVALDDQTKLVEALKEAVGNSPTWYYQMKRDLEYEFPRLFTGGRL